VQSVWLTLLHNLHSVTEPRALANWLIVTTRREASKVRGSTDRVDPLPDYTLEFLTSAEGLPEEESLRNDRDRQLWRAFHQLSQREQELLRLTVLAGRAEYDMVAKKLGLARSSIGPLRGRAIARLRTMLVEEESITHEQRLSDEAAALTEHGSRQGSPAQQVTTSLRPHELLEERNAIDQIANKVDDELRTRFTKARNAFSQRRRVHVTDTADATTFRVLGPMEVKGTIGTIRIPPGRQQVILASLLMEANQVVTIDHLVDALWDDAPPSTARTQVQICVSRLRKSLTSAGVDTPILSRPPGYLLRVDESMLDMHVFTSKLTKARALAKDGRPADSAALLRSAAALWRGPCLAGISHRALRTWATRLDEDRLDAIETYIELELGLGLHHQLVGELTRLVHEHPLRERLRGLLMCALYLAGRQAEALAVYRAGRDMLIDELGLEPGDELRSLESAILAGDTSALLRSTQQTPASTSQSGSAVSTTRPGLATALRGHELWRAVDSLTVPDRTTTGPHTSAPTGMWV
jgi:RNA polymerase sigma factor (sigma-70 family)